MEVIKKWEAKADGKVFKRCTLKQRSLNRQKGLEQQEITHEHDDLSGHKGWKSGRNRIKLREKKGIKITHQGFSRDVSFHGPLF